MSVQSMTGFGQGETIGEKYTLNVEIKAVNHRFKDIRFKMSSLFNSKEMPLRKKMEASFTRGSFDIYVNYKKNQTEESSIDLDYNKIQAFLSGLQSNINLPEGSLQVKPTDFIRSDFLQEDDSKQEELLELIDKTIDAAISSLAESRKEEGQKLVAKLKEHQALYTEHYKKVIGLKDTYQENVKTKLLKKFENDTNDLTLDEPRFLQEVIYYLEKLDVDEEINRIQIHLEKLEKLLAKGSTEVGRQIDFLIQELNRETNTIGSKSGSGEISENVVQMKVQLEKIREQALNLQ